MFDGWRTFHSLQLSVNRRFRNGLQFGLNDTIGALRSRERAARLQHNPDGTLVVPRRSAAGGRHARGGHSEQRHIFKGNFVWDLPDLRASSGGMKALGLVVNDWQFSGVWTASTGVHRTAEPTPWGIGYSGGGGNVNITGSPDYAGRVRIVGDPGRGCSDDPYRQFNATAFQGPLYEQRWASNRRQRLSAGLLQSVLDLAIARNFRLGGSRNLQLRAEMFNAPNAGHRHRPQHDDESGEPSRSGDDHQPAVRCRTAPSTQARAGATRALAQANGWQAPRSVQVQVRFQF